MKGLIRTYFIHVLALHLAVNLFGGSLTINGPILNLFAAGGILTALDLLIKPILKLLFFPINVLSLGLFSIVINAIVFYVFYQMTPYLKITSWTFPGLSYNQYSLLPMTFDFWPTLFVIASVISVLTGFMVYLTRD